MTIKINVQCESCKHIYSLYSQWDSTLNEYEWPITIHCIECGDIMNIHYTNNGLKEKDFFAKDQEVRSTMVGFSATLPVPLDIYMQPESHSPMFHSTFLNLGRYGFNHNDFQASALVIGLLRNNVYPFKDCFKLLLPIMLRGNAQAFILKAKKIFGNDLTSKVDTSIDNCKGMYDALIESTYKNLMYPKYKDLTNKYYRPLLEFVSNSDKTLLVKTYEELKQNYSLTNWERQEAYQFIGTVVSKIEKFYPTILLINSPGYDTQKSDLAITTIDEETANDLYTQGYETLSHAVHVLVGIANIVYHGEINDFGLTQAKGKTFQDFVSLNAGTKLNILMQYPEVFQLLNNSYDNRIRNAISHNGVDSIDENQQIRYHYDSKDDSKVYQTSLIDVVASVYMMLMHIIEIQVLISVIKSRIR